MIRGSFAKIFAMSLYFFFFLNKLCLCSWGIVQLLRYDMNVNVDAKFTDDIINRWHGSSTSQRTIRSRISNISDALRTERNLSAQRVFIWPWWIHVALYSLHMIIKFSVYCTHYFYCYQLVVDKRQEAFDIEIGLKQTRSGVFTSFSQMERAMNALIINNEEQ